MGLHDNFQVLRSVPVGVSFDMRNLFLPPLVSGFAKVQVLPVFLLHREKLKGECLHISEGLKRTQREGAARKTRGEEPCQHSSWSKLVESSTGDIYCGACHRVVGNVLDGEWVRLLLE